MKQVLYCEAETLLGNPLMFHNQQIKTEFDNVYLWVLPFICIYKTTTLLANVTSVLGAVIHYIFVTRHLQNK